MYNAKYILPGLIVFLGVATLPFWYNVASGSSAGLPEIDPHSRELQCVLDADTMRSTHMQLLDDWRDEVVREGKRVYTAPDGRQFTMSLTNTCLDCHESKQEFCDKCHSYAGVEPNCWSCHVDPTSSMISSAVTEGSSQ